MKDTDVHAFLQPEETIRREERRHPLSILDDVLWLFVFVALVGTGFTFLFLQLPRHVDLVLTILWCFLAFLFFLYVFVRIRRVVTSRFLITDERVYTSHGYLFFTLAQSTYDKVTDLHIHQSLFGRWLGFGTVRLHTAGAVLSLPGVRDPAGIKVSLEEARAAFIQRLVGEHRKTRGKHVEAAKIVPAAAAPTTTWAGRPTAVAFLGTWISAAFMFLFALVFAIVLAAAFDPGMFFMPALFILLPILISVHAVITLRYTHYEIHSNGLVVMSGWLGRKRVETRFEKITDVTTQQSLLGRLLNFGTIQANTAGGIAAPIHFRGVADPLAVKGLIEQARERTHSGART